MNFASLTAIATSVFTSTSLLPQLIKISRGKKAEDVSSGILIILFIGLGLWVCYGLLKKDWIITLSNGVSLAMNVCVAILSIRYKKQPVTN